MKEKVKRQKKDFESYDFSKEIMGKRLPLLILDEKWLELFEIDKMPKEVKALQAKLTKMVVEQGKYAEEIDGFKRYKSQLLQEIVDNMGIDDSAVGVIKSRKMEKNQKLINELNEKISFNEQRLNELPNEIQRVNEELLVVSSNICYTKLNKCVEAVKDLDEQINILKEQLVMKELEKQNYEENISRMYTYMHSMYGSKIIDILDIKNRNT